MQQHGAEVGVPHDDGLLKCGSKKVLESPGVTVSNELMDRKSGN
jgi:hypothetical protein